MYNRNNKSSAFVDCTAKKRLKIRNIPVFPIVLYIFLLLVSYGLSIFNGILPTPLYLVDEKPDRDAFMSERAYQDLKALKDFGPHIVSTYESEVLVADFLINQINAIMDNVHQNQEWESIVLKSNKDPLYVNATSRNIVVKIHGAKNESSSLLINARFDTNPLTMSKSTDNEINCATMLEILRIFSNRPTRLSNNIIFSFTQGENNAYESGLLFIDKWSTECKIMLNLNSLGVGGKNLLIEGGPAWLMDYYGKVPHPYAQVFAEEMHKYFFHISNDFEIFRHKIGVVGFDMAFFNDLVEDIALGSLQHIGDNLLFLVINIANAPELSNTLENMEKSIYFDVFGFFMITYSETLGRVINYFVALLSFAISAYVLYTLSRDDKMNFSFTFRTFRNMVAGWILSELCIIQLGILTDYSLYSKSWYGNSWLIFLLYCAPSLAITLLLRLFVEDEGMDENVRRHVNVLCVMIVWTVLLLLGTILNLRSTYVLTVLLLFNNAAIVLIHAFKLQNSVKTWQTIYIISLLIPNILILYSSLITVSLLISLSAKDDFTYSDHLVGIASSIFTFLMTFSFNALITSKHQIKNLVILLSLVSAVGYIICFAPLTFPYRNSPGLAKYWIMHTRRTAYNQTGSEISRDSGYLVINVHTNPSKRLNRYIKPLRDAEPVNEHCYSYFFLCGCPIVFPEFRWLKRTHISDRSLWIPAEEPSFQQDIELTVLSKDYFAPYLKYKLSLIGPDRMAIYLIAEPSNILVGTSLISVYHPPLILLWNNSQQNGYYYAIENIQDSESPFLVNSFTFTVDVQISDNSSETAMRIAVSGIYMHDDVNKKSLGYVQFLKQFPNWADVTPWLGSSTTWWI